MESKITTEIILPETAVVKIGPEFDPGFHALKEQVTGIQKYSEGRIIKSDEDVKPAVDDLTLIGQVMKAVEDLRKQYVGPLNDHVKAINATFKTLTEPLDQANTVTRRKIQDYRTETERRRMEAEEINRQKDELARKEAALNGGEFTVDTTPVVVPAAPAAHVRTDAGTLGTRKVRKARVIDFAKLPDAYKLENTRLLATAATSGVKEIAGVEFFWDESLTVRGNK